MSAPPEDSVPDAPPAGASRTDRRHYRGVTYDKRSGTWRVRISCLGLQHHVGRYNDQEEAAQMYDKIAYTLYGDAAITNFGVAAAAASDCRVPAHVLALRHKLNAFKWQVQQLQRASTGPAPPPPPPGGAGSSRQPGPPPAAPGAAAGAQPGPLLAPPPAMAPLAGMTWQQVAGMQPQQPMGAPGAYPSLPGTYPSAPQQQQVGWVQAYGMPNPQPQQLVYFGGAPQQPHPQYPMVMGPVNPTAQPHMLQAGSNIAMHPGGGVGLQQGVMPGGSSTAFYSMAGPGQVVYLGTASGATLPPGSAPLLVSPFQSVAAAAAAASGTGHPTPAGMGVDQGSSTMQALGGSPVPGVTSGLVTPITGLPAGTFMAISQEGVQGQVDVLQLLQALDTRQLSQASSGSSASTQLQLSPSYWGLTPAPGSIESIATFPVMSSPGLQVAPITSVPMGGASPEPASSGMDVPQAGLLSSFGLLQLTDMQQQQLVFNPAGPSGAQLPGGPHQLPIQAASAAIEALSTGWPTPVSTGESSNLAGAGWQHAASSPALEPLQHVPGQMLMLPASSTPPAW